jgi:hypothetical protein
MADDTAGHFASQLPAAAGKRLRSQMQSGNEMNWELAKAPRAGFEPAAYGLEVCWVLYATTTQGYACPKNKGFSPPLVRSLAASQPVRRHGLECMLSVDHCGHPMATDKRTARRHVVQRDIQYGQIADHELLPGQRGTERSVCSSHNFANLGV